MNLAIAVAYSGGRDSTALLHATWRAALFWAAEFSTGAAEAVMVEVHALHVHHGLNPKADDWAEHCARQCQQWHSTAPDPARVTLQFHQTRLPHAPQAGDSIEAWARERRYRALAAMAQAVGCDTVLLAHHREDQAETFLLQALRGAGPAGLAAMPTVTEREGVRWCRPWLHRPRAALEAYVEAHQLDFIDDDSNADTRYARNRLRHDVLPKLTAAFPQAPQMLAQAAQRAQDAAECLDALAALDVQTLRQQVQSTLGASGFWGDASPGLPTWGAASLGAARWRNVLRCWLREQWGTSPRASWIERLAVEVLQASQGRWPVRAPVPGELQLYRGWLVFVPAASVGVLGHETEGAAPAAEQEEVALPDLAALPPGSTVALPAWGGALWVCEADEPEAQRQGAVVASAVLDGLIARSRRGGEQFQRTPNTPARALKKQYQAAGVPAWLREGPLLWHGERLVFVPGLGVAAWAQAEPGAPGRGLVWRRCTAGAP